MSFKNTTLRLVLPFVRKNLRNERTSTWINERQLSTQSINKNIVISRIRNNLFHTTSRINSIVSFNLSDIGEGIQEVVVKEWYVKEGDKVNQFDNICEVQSDKASVTITSRYDGIVNKLYHAVDDICLVGKPLVDIEIEDGIDDPQTEKTLETVSPVVPTEVKPEMEVKSQKNNIQDETNNIFAIPSVRRLAQENKINLVNVIGTGKSGRILKEDILKHIETVSQQKITIEKAEVHTASSYTKPVRGYAKAMVKTMTEAMKVPHFVYNDELSVTNLVKLRAKLKPHADKIGVRITYLPFFIKATSNALSRYPVLNSKLDETLDNVIYINNHNIGVAMNTPNGLVVPVIKNVQNKGIIEISTELNRLQELSKTARFTQEDLSDGTFTFSNIGAIGGTYASPIILPPQSAIIALGAFKNVPRFDSNGAVLSENIAYISGAADHRIIDGATMASFCNVLKQQIEEPLLLFLNI